MDTVFQDQVIAARTYLTCRYPFYSFLLHRASIVADDSVGTACVNRAGQITISPKFFEGLITPSYRAFVLAHEILHPAFGYFSRSVGHHPELANIAHDHVINLLLDQECASSNTSWVIPGSLCNKRFEGMCYEEVYSILKNELPQDKDGNRTLGDGEGESVDGVKGSSSISGIGLDIQHVSPSGSEETEEEPDWTLIVARAAEGARMAGNLPAHIDRLVKKLLNPVVPWQEKLKLAVTDALSKSRLDWSTPHRRSESYGCYTPREEALGFDVSICVDSSGSISEAELERAISEIHEIISFTAGDGRYIVGDCAVHADIALADFKPDMVKGGGGTSFVPHFEYLERYPTKLCVFFTDTFGEFPDREPNFPVIWAVYKPAMRGGANVPFGEIVEVEV